MRLKRVGFFALVAITAISISYLIPIECSHEASEEKPPGKVETPRPPTKNGDPRPRTCAGESCQPNDEEVVEEAEDTGTPDAQHCDTPADCGGCGYGCTYNKCHKLAASCCQDADCGKGLACVRKEDELSGTCVLSQCDEDKECGDRCGTHCINHRCEKTHCCADNDCPAEKFCDLKSGYQLDNGNIEGNCKIPQCFSNADCQCQEACIEHYCVHSYMNEAPMKCCGTDVSIEFSYDSRPAWTCMPHERIEDGRCVVNSNCPAGQVCYEQMICLPASCEKNSDCGCEAVCRKGRCELGCDNNSDCCTSDDICDRGQCKSPDE